MGEHGGTKQGGTMQDDNDTRTEQLSLRRGNEGPTSRVLGKTRSILRLLRDNQFDASCRS